MPDLDDLMRMAQEAQNKLMQAQEDLDKVEVQGVSGGGMDLDLVEILLGLHQEDLDKVEVQGVSGGGMVKVRASAKGRIIGVEIDASLLAPSEKQMLEDLVAAAINDARAKADVAAQEAMREVTGGLQLPPDFKMPF